MKSRIVAFRKDLTEENSWIAELSCGHTQHVRHDPVMSPRPWVLSEEGRAQHVGLEIQCRQCAEKKGKT